MFTPLENGHIRLDEPITQLIVERGGHVHRVTVHAGYVSDGASIPRWFWPIIGPPMRAGYLVPAVIHDYLCEQAQNYHDRVIADAVFFKLLWEHGIPRWKRAMMFVAVRTQGRLTWRRKAGLR